MSRLHSTRPDYLLKCDCCDKIPVQLPLAARAVDLFAGLFREDDSPRRLPRKIWTAAGNLRRRGAEPAFESTLNMAARSERGRSKHCFETRECVTGARTGFALRADHNDNDRLRVSAQNCAALDRSYVHAAGLL